MRRLRYAAIWRTPGLLLVLWALLVTLPTGSRSETLPTTPLKVAATIFPLYDLIRQVAGPTIEVVLLVPPGASEHTFTVKPGTVRALSGCAAVFSIGHGLDDWVTRLAQEAGVPRTIITDTGVTLLRGQHESHGHGHKHPPSTGQQAVDPHYWLTIPNALRMVQTIAEMLAQLDPSRQPEVQQRLAAYQEHLRQTDAEIRHLLTDLPQRTLATFHMAFEYRKFKRQVS